MVPFEEATISISIDGVMQQPATISKFGNLVPFSSQSKFLGRNSWEYCVSGNWQLGFHIVRMVVTPVQGPTRSFDWNFEVHPLDTF